MSFRRVKEKLRVAAFSGFFAFYALFNLTHAAPQTSIDEQLSELRVKIQKNDDSVDALISHFKEYFLSNNDPYSESKFLNILAYKGLLTQELENGYVYLLQARTKAELSKNLVAEAESYRTEGAILDTVGEYGAALEKMNKSLTLYTELQSDKVLLVYSSLSNVYSSLGDHKGMLNNAYNQLAAAQKFDSKSGEAGAYTRIGNAQTNLNQLVDATFNFDIAERLYAESDYPFIGIIYYSIAKLNVKKGNFEEALRRISQSIEADRKVDFRYNEVPRLILLAEIYEKQGNIEKAYSELERSLDIEGLKKDKIQFLNILEKLIELSSSVGDADGELKFLKQYNELYKESFNEQQAKLLSINNVRLNILEKEEEIKLLQKENELQIQRTLAQQESNRYQLYLTLVVFVTLLLVSGLFMRTRRQKDQLNTYSQELEKATQAKSDFLARMSHEIRTPINAISGLTKLMQRKAENSEDITNLQQIDDASLTLLGVINDILDFSKIEAGKLDIEVTSIQLDKVVSQSIRLQSLKAHEKNIELIQHIARDVPLYLKGDGLRIQQILVNLLGNAVKFTDDGLVSVSVKKKYAEQGVLLEFAVKDTGIGMTSSQTKDLFQSFSQVDESISRKYGGTGLGLAICKQLAELMGGEIWVESQAGEGSTFHFTVLVEEDKTQLAISPSEKLSSLKILVADDVSLSRQAIAEALLQANINADLADGGRETLNKMRLAAADRKPYDILILDWKMPDLDGMEVAAILNQEFQANKPKIIMLSAFDFSRLREQARGLGVKFFIEKPFSASELINKLQELAFDIKVDTPLALTKSSNAPDLTGKRILLAEDNKLNLKVAMGFLKETNADVFWAKNGLKVLEMLNKGPDYDCILMDVQMPEMDGLTATHKIRNELQLDLPIVAMTAHAMKQDMEKSAAAGMTAHITKPIDPEYLYQVLTEVLLANSQQLLHKQLAQAAEKKSTSVESQIDDLLLMDRQKAMDTLFVNEEYFQSMLADFVTMKSSIETLASLIESKDYQRIYKVSHDAVSSLTYIGAYELAKLAKSVESVLNAQEQESTEGFEQQLILFNQALLQLVTKIERELAES